MIKLTIDSLLLDSQNPRIDAVSSQREALQEVIADQGDKLYALAESIVDDGLSPLDNLLVLRQSESSKKYIALEGNRRVAALKILANPACLTGLDLPAALRKRFESLAAKFSRESVEPILAPVARSREEGNKWLYLRHTGENQGRGVVQWTGVAAARFRGRDPALQALEFVRTYGGLDNEQKTLLDRYFPITTLNRLLETPDVRKRLGLEINEKALTTKFLPAEVIKPLRRIVLDLATKRKTVTQLKSKAQQMEYVESFPSSDRPDLSSAGEQKGIDTFTPGDFKSSNLRRPRATRAAGAIERRTLAPSRLRLNILNPKISEIFKELRSMRVEDLPNASAVLLRVFLELSVDAFLQANKISLKKPGSGGGREIDKPLKEKVSEAVEKLVADGNDRKDFLAVTRGLSVNHSPLSIDLLHAYIHNRFVTPKPRELISAWDDAQPFFERLWP